MERPRILLTGFGPFPGVPTNPSGWLAETLAERLPAPELQGRIHARIFPTEWQAAALLPNLCETLQPHVMIHFGVSEHAKTFRIEHSAHNRTAPRADAGGALPASPVILVEGAGRLDTAFPAAALARHLKTNGVAAVTSHSAGHYLCNFLYYHSLDWALRQPDPSPRAVRARSAYVRQRRRLYRRDAASGRARDLALHPRLRRRARADTSCHSLRP